MSLKNKYLAIIYRGCIDKDPVRKIHKALYDATINRKTPYTDKYLLAYAIKLTNKAKKVSADGSGMLAMALFSMFKRENANEKAKKIINQRTQTVAEKEKADAIDDFIDKSRDKDEWFYLASSHDDCAKDHLPYQGKLYVDEKAPDDIIDYARKKGLYTVQWVMDAPAYFITRPNCRHFFVSLSLRQVTGKSLKKLKKMHRTHSMEGHKALATPKTEAINEYTDRLKMLRALNAEYPTDTLKADILKTEMLLKKWKHQK